MGIEQLHQREQAELRYEGGPKVRALELITLDMGLYGTVQPETKARILDEELTWAAELVAQQTEYALIPRHYQRIEGDLVDTYGVSLSRVMWGGLDAVRASKDDGVIGAQKEELRRYNELRNFQRLVELPKNRYMVEFSLTDETWTEAENKQWGYSGDTLIRISYVNNLGDVEQVNVCIPLTGKKLARALKKEFALAGPIDADSLLANPTIGSYSGDFSGLITSIERRISHAERTAHPILRLASLIKTIRKKRKDAWQLVSGNTELNEQLWSELVRISALPAQMWEYQIDDVRRGFWKLSIESTNSMAPISGIVEASARSRTDGDTFTACGSTSEIAQSFTAEAISYGYRVSIVATLYMRKGKGSCEGCKDYSDLYGCGPAGTFCKSCNDTWCKEYLATGKMIEPKELSDRKYRWYLGRR